MRTLIWRDSYSIGIDTLDEQHKTLLGYINELYESQKTSTSQAVIKDMIQKLHDYSVFHFKNEEDLEIECNYDKYDTNKKSMNSSFQRLMSLAKIRE
jgi:hemerythrin